MTVRSKILAGLLGFALMSVFQANSEAAERYSDSDTARIQALESRLEEYLSAIAAEPVQVQKEESDFLIETCSDPEIRQSAALKIYRYYRDSRIMGLEAVAIHIYDKWFASGLIEMPDKDEKFAAGMHAEFNRQSLIGMDAPEIELTDSTGQTITLFDKDRKTEGNSRYSVLYFYSTDCQKCRLESIVLRNILDSTTYPLDFYAIYTGQDMEQWREYSGRSLNIDNSSVRTFHLWDPDLSSDFQMKYGILQTPGMFLVSPEGKIAGRKLDSISLSGLLETLLEPVSLDYGSDGSADFFDRVFAPFGDSISCTDIMSVARHIEASTYGKGDTVMFRQMTGDLLYYLNSRRGESYRLAQKELIRKYISGNNAWRTADDSLKTHRGVDKHPPVW